MSQKTIIRICAVVMGISGVVIIFSTLYPLAIYEAHARKNYPILISPLADSSQESDDSEIKDYTKASNWFGDKEKEKDYSSQKITYFTLSIPKLRIDNASVAVGGEDLSENLIQYSGTALPGKIGNSVIFGHSVLPQFFDPDNYLSIFSTLPRIDEGDLVYVNYDGITYTYEVEDMFEVRPTDIQILEQNRSGSYLTLVTCTPPGDPRKPKRLIVRAKLMES